MSKTTMNYPYFGNLEERAEELRKIIEYMLPGNGLKRMDRLIKAQEASVVLRKITPQ